MQKRKYIIHNIKYLIHSLFKKRDGQSLIEILVGLSIGAILIGGAGFGISFMLKSTTSSDDMQAASGIVRQTLDEVRSYVSANWQNIYGLTKGLNTQYFLNASGTTFYTVQGKEGFLSKDVTNGLVGRWGFDEATGTIAYDMSGNGNDGILTNNPARATSTCWIGYCLGFNGSNTFIDAGTNSVLKISGDITLSVWVNWTSGTGYIVGRGTGNDYLQMWYSRVNSDGTIEFIAGNAAGTGYSFDLTTTNLISSGTWNHIIAQISSSTANIFINGTLAGSRSALTRQSNDGNLYIGKRIDNFAPFNGKIDDVRIYNRVLSAAEVKNLYESKPFSAYFSIENACRSNDSSSTITDTEPCQGGSIVDPITEEITATAEWNTRGATDSISLTDYATRWKNDIFHQTDWSGGSGIDGPLTSPTTQYASSTNVDATTNPGSMRIFGL